MTQPLTPGSLTGAPLLAVRSAQPLTAIEALSWCWPAAPADEVVGFGYALDSAEWWRLVDGIPTGPHGKPVDLTRVYEFAAFDGRRELRWLEDVGTGFAVVIAEDGALLPSERAELVGEPDRPLRRLMIDTPDGTRSHVLAGRVQVSDATGGWVELRSDRLNIARIPYRWARGETPAEAHLALQYVEYVHVDLEGNLTVVDSRLTGIHPHTDPPANGTNIPTGDDR